MFARPVSLVAPRYTKLLTSLISSPSLNLILLSGSSSLTLILRISVFFLLIFRPILLALFHSLLFSSAFGLLLWRSVRYHLRSQGLLINSSFSIVFPRFPFMLFASLSNRWLKRRGIPTSHSLASRLLLLWTSQKFHNC